jgi:hypothetical protein
MFVAVASNSGQTGVIHTLSSQGTGEDAALSKGLLVKDTSFGTAQTATVLTGAVLSLYANVSTTTAITASGGSFSGSAGNSGVTATYAGSLRTTLFSGSTPSLRDTVGTLWTAPTTPGTYIISLYGGNGLGTTPTEAAPAVTLGAQITVSVVAASAGGSYSAAYSACNTNVGTKAITAGAGTAGVDSTGTVTDGNSWFIDLDLNDAYNANLSSGNLVATATNGALLNFGTGAATPVAGTASTDVEYGTGAGATVRIDQPTSGAPLTTTVTITYNGTTVCTKTVTIRGKASKITVANIGTAPLSAATVNPQWMYQEIGVYNAGNGTLFSALVTDSAGNIVATPATYGTWSADAATLTTTVQTVQFPIKASSTSSTSTDRFTLGYWTCGASAGEANIKIKFTNSGTGDVLTSDAFKARCADVPYTYTASLDKASYVQGEIATATVKFLDSKGNAANSNTAVGANTWSLPMMTGVSFTISSGASATAVTKADGTVSYTFTIGASDTAITAGTYTGIIDYSAPVGGVKSTPTYKLSTGGDTTTNADVLKSIVALIASINKQIQALQKLILKR